MSATPYKLQLAHAVIAVGRSVPHEPLGGLINSILSWQRLPRLSQRRDGARWIRQFVDARTGEVREVRPNQFANLIKRTAHTPSETAILYAALHRAAATGGQSR